MCSRSCPPCAWKWTLHTTIKTFMSTRSKSWNRRSRRKPTLTDPAPRPISCCVSHRFCTTSANPKPADSRKTARYLFYSTMWLARAWSKNGCAPYASITTPSRRWRASWSFICASTATVRPGGPTRRYVDTCGTQGSSCSVSTGFLGRMSPRAISAWRARWRRHTMIWSGVLMSLPLKKSWMRCALNWMANRLWRCWASVLGLLWGRRINSC